MNAMNKQAQAMSPLVMIIIALAVMAVVLFFFVGGAGELGEKFAGTSEEVSGETSGVVDIISDTSLREGLGGSPPRTYTTAPVISSPDGICRVDIGIGWSCISGIEMSIEELSSGDICLCVLKEGDSFEKYGCRVTIEKCFGSTYEYTVQEIG